jgi:hypothetical protein
MKPEVHPIIRTNFVHIAIALIYCLSVPALADAPGSAASGTPQHVMHLVKLPNGDYTVPMNELLDPSWTGNVRLHPVGLKTLVIVTVKGTHLRKHALELHPGADCNAFGGADGIKLNPANTGVPSSTLVSLPITNLTSNDYVVAARDATSAQQYKESCAHL